MNYNNPNFEIVFESEILINEYTKEPLKFYAHKNITEYHTSRYIASNAQNIYSSAGLTPDLINAICDEMINAVEKNKITNVAVLANNLKYRTKYPVDEDAILRMAMIYYLVDEEPELHQISWTEWKLAKIKQDPKAYAFFLPIGIQLTPSYMPYLAEISENFLQLRREKIKQLTPLL